MKSYTMVLHHICLNASIPRFLLAPCNHPPPLTPTSRVRTKLDKDVFLLTEPHALNLQSVFIMYGFLLNDWFKYSAVLLPPYTVHWRHHLLLLLVQGPSVGWRSVESRLVAEWSKSWMKIRWVQTGGLIGLLGSVCLELLNSDKWPVDWTW